MLKPFGCLWFASTLKSDRTKLDPKADPFVFIGYAQNKKGFKLYNLKTITVLISRDVKFKERFFPYQIMNLDTQTTSQIHFLHMLNQIIIKKLAKTIVVEAIKKELEALSKNITWVVVSFPKRKKTLDANR